MSNEPQETSHSLQIAKRVKQYKNFPGYKGKSDIELARIAEEKIRIDNLLEDLDIESQFEDKEEKKQSTVLAKKYLNDYTFEFVSDKNTLKQLIYLEMINIRLQKMLNEFYRDSQAVPTQMMEGLHKNVMQITALKETLGLVKDDKNEAATGMSAIDVLKKKFKKWRAENNGSRTIVCPECSKMVLLKIRTDAWEAMKHPYFCDRFLGNRKLFDLVYKNVLTKKQVADILETSEDYVDWIMAKLAPLNTIAKINEVADAASTMPVNSTETALEGTIVEKTASDTFVSQVDNLDKV
jgi:DNA-directed RNA polymerase subunit RPC12/RpoP